MKVELSLQVQVQLSKSFSLHFEMLYNPIFRC